MSAMACILREEKDSVPLFVCITGGRGVGRKIVGCQIEYHLGRRWCAARRRCLSVWGGDGTRSDALRGLRIGVLLIRVVVIVVGLDDVVVASDRGPRGGP